MKQRGRQSGESKVAEAALAGKAGRPDAPYDLTDEQAEEWWAVVNRMPTDWFARETHSLLSQHCRLTTRLRRLAQLINALETSEKPLELAEYRAMLKSECEMTRSLAIIDTKMRLTQLATYDRQKKIPVKVRKPWEPL